jgi:hypothetical protein
MYSSLLGKAQWCGGKWTAYLCHLKAYSGFIKEWEKSFGFDMEEPHNARGIKKGEKVIYTTNALSAQSWEESGTCSVCPWGQVGIAGKVGF